MGRMPTDEDPSAQHLRDQGGARGSKGTRSPSLYHCKGSCPQPDAEGFINHCTFPIRLRGIRVFRRGRWVTLRNPAIDPESAVNRRWAADRVSPPLQLHLHAGHGARSPLYANASPMSHHRGPAASETPLVPPLEGSRLSRATGSRGAGQQHNRQAGERTRPRPEMDACRRANEETLQPPTSAQRSCGHAPLHIIKNFRKQTNNYWNKLACCLVPLH
ncbi:unnamed protein product [Boreogadus saida]